MPIHQFQIEAEEAGTRIDAFLATKLEVSRARAQSLLATTLLNGAAVKAKYQLRVGDVVDVDVPEAVELEESVLEPSLVPRLPESAFLYQDDDLLVLNKPRGLTVHAGAGETGATLVDVLRGHGIPLSGVGPQDRAGIVHRLDKDTSGVMIVAKTDAAHWELAKAFEERRVQKTYMAFCNGIPPTKGRIEAPIGRHHSNRKKMAVVPEGRFAVTEYEIEKKWDKFAKLKVNLLTGRTHQIRVHLAYVNFAIVGDGVYGGLHRALESAPTPEVRDAMEALDGQALHAHKIAFVHPVTGVEMEFEAPIPLQMQAIEAELDKV
jgi:23S rRNA pseudouridine1911/1915/1917 synthase